MYKYLFAGLVATVMFANDANATPEPAAPVPDHATAPTIWRYSVLAAGLDLFDSAAPRHAPGSSLRFKAPHGDSAPAPLTVDLALKGGRVSLLNGDGDSFTLPRDENARSERPDIVTNIGHRRDHEVFPIVEVRTPGLPHNVLRLGDLRLACAVQLELFKSHMLKIRALFGVMGMFGVSPCTESGLAHESPGMFDSVTLSAGTRSDVKTLPKPSGEYDAPLGDKTWPDDTLIEFKLNGAPAGAKGAL